MTTEEKKAQKKATKKAKAKNLQNLKNSSKKS